MGQIGMVVGRTSREEIEAVAFYEKADCLHHTRQRFAIAVVHRIVINEHDGTLTTLLSIVNPTNHGHHGMHERLVIHAVSTMEMNGLGIMLTEKVVGVHQLVLVAKESPHTGLGLCEALFGNFAVGLHQGFVDIEFLHTILTWIQERLLTHHVMFAHGVGNLKCRVHKDSVETMQLLCKHSTHRRA